MMRRSQPSGAQDRKRKIQEQKSNQAQFGSLEPFVVRQKKINDDVEENVKNNKNPVNYENSKNDDAANESEHENVNESEHENINESGDVGVNNNKGDHVQKANESVDIFDVRVWDGLRSNMKDLL
ncbi:hypothetical protein Tco_1100036, partial [Tanacetum coccineum]